jgi:hypothetical protein
MTIIDKNIFEVNFSLTVFTRLLCKTNINDCGTDPSISGGTCLDLIAKYECECPPDLHLFDFKQTINSLKT